MVHEDIDSAYRTNSLALADTAEERERVQDRGPEEIEKRKLRYHYFLKHDPDGAWVAAEGDRVVGSAVALVREGVWILSLFAVAEGYRNSGVGGELLRRALGYGRGCKGAMIASSTHPAAMRRYARAGFALHPTLMAKGTVHRETIPAGLVARDGMEGDLELAAEVDRLVRGAAHGPDLEVMLKTGGRLLIAERRSGKGYAVEWKGSPGVVAATRPEIASDLLWACLERGDEVEVRWITAAQNWAVPVVLGAGLSLAPSGPICTRGELGPLAPYLPSGPYL